MLNLEDLNWFAGYSEGEANFRTMHKSYSPLVQIVSTDFFPIEKCKRLLGGNISGPYNSNKGHKSYWRWYLIGKPAAELFEDILPFLSPRRKDQIEKALEIYKAKPKCGFEKTHCKNGHPFDESNCSIYGPKGWRICRTCKKERYLRNKKCKS